MSRIAYVNGRYVPHAQASVHIEDRGYQFADGVYEVVYLWNGRLIDADLHLDRLDRSLRELRITPPLSRAALQVILAEMVARNRRRHGLIYLQVTRGVAKRDHAFPPAGTRPALVITLRAAPQLPASIDSWTARAIALQDARWARCDIKSTALLPNVLARQQARDQGATEAILIDPDGMVTEGASTTVWIVDSTGTLATRPLSHAILPGCTRQALITELAQAGIAFQERAFPVADLREAREIFLTSASSFIKPVIALDGAPVGQGTPGPVARLLFDLFTKHVRGHEKEGVLF
jgi:D-alanine transaminase